MGEDLKNKAFQYYISKGFSPEAAAGLVGTFISESQLIPTSTNSSSGAYGLAQWLGPRKRELFRRYGSNPTFENQLDYTWYELNNTHKNALKYLKNAKTPEEAANTVFGYYQFMTGPEGAIREMKKYGQNGKASLAQKVKYANNVYKSIVGDTTPLPLVKLQPVSVASNSLAENMLPEVTISGKRPTLTIPSSLYANKNNTSSTEDAMFSLAGLNPEDYAFKFTPPVMNISHYADGKDRKPRIITTGGAGYVPPLNTDGVIQSIVANEVKNIIGDLPLDTVRYRLYNNIAPHSYANVKDRFKSAVKYNTPSEIDRLNIHRSYRDDIFAEYLQIPDTLRRGNPAYKIKKNSNFMPAVRKSNDDVYFHLPLSRIDWEEIIGDVKNGYTYFEHNPKYELSGSKRYKISPLGIGESAPSKRLGEFLGNHTISRGYDNRGEYVSYYDKWDLAPLKGYGEDESMGIGKPVELYDRMYLDSFYGVDQPTHATYLPEVVIKPHKK